MGANLLKLTLVIIGFGIILPAFVTRLTMLASGPFGAIFYYSNVMSDFFMKRGHLPRGLVEIILFAVGLGCLSLADVKFWPYMFIVALVLILLELWTRITERRILNTVYAFKDLRRNNCIRSQKNSMHYGAIPSPSVHPELVINFSGPFVRRMPNYQLGDLPLGRTFEIGIIIANHSLMPCQVPIFVEINSGLDLQLDSPAHIKISPLESGDFFCDTLRFVARRISAGGEIAVAVAHGSQRKITSIKYTSIFDSARCKFAVASIMRYPVASQAAFAWRGDMDLYDTTTFQSVDGLSKTLDLASRYRFPQTLFLSTRLSLDAEESSKYYGYFGVSRGQDHVPKFIRWMKTHVEFRHEIRYPFRSEKPYALELGNHMHHHYGTDAAAAQENSWRLLSGIGAGVYPWMSGDQDSFSEQRDNALAARRMMEVTFGFTPKSWAMPDSINDRFTAAAVEAAGCEVLSDSNSSHVQNVLVQPPPHHPEGTAAVELTKRYPGDPQDLFHMAMVLYWIHRAHRRSIPVIFMCHQHLRLFEGHACTRFTEAIMRYVLTRFNGDLHVNTVYGVGIYWQEVLSPKTRKVEVKCLTDRVEVRNMGVNNLEDLPLDVRYEDGKVSSASRFAGEINQCS